MTRLLLGLIWLYRWTLGLVLPDTCRFTPTCSRYSAEALRRRGILRGGALALWRILRCQPFGGSGHDPVQGSQPPCRSRPRGRAAPGEAPPGRSGPSPA